jgi:transcriptional regulator GlxA family with amidase domain
MTDDASMKQRNVAIFIFDEVEILDFTGPYEVFNVSGEVLKGFNPFNVYTVGIQEYPIETRGKMTVTPKWSIETAPPADILIIPGGEGTRPLIDNKTVIDWLKTQAPKVELLLSVCTGALLLGKAGLLDGLEATTHNTAFDLLRSIAPKTTLRRKKRYVDTGKIITSGGITAGIDMSLYVVRNLLGEEALAGTLSEMEYTWKEDK